MTVSGVMNGELVTKGMNRRMVIAGLCILSFMVANSDVPGLARVGGLFLGILMLILPVKASSK